MRPRAARRSRLRQRRCSIRSQRSNRWSRPYELELYRASRALTASRFRVRRTFFGLSKHILRPPPPGLRHLGDRNQPAGFMVIAGVDAKYIADGEVLIGPLDDPDVIAGPHLALGHDPQVRPRPQRLGEAAREHLVAHPNPKPPARDARLGNLEHGAPDLPALADERVVHLDSVGREIFAKLAVCKRSAELLFPPPRILDGVGVDRLVGSPVCLAIRLVVPGEVYASDCNPSGDRRFPDGTLGRAPVVFKLARPADVDRNNRSCRTRHGFPQSTINNLAPTSVYDRCGSALSAT